MAAIYQHSTSGRYKRFDSRAAAQLWMMSPGSDGFATANEAACTTHNDSQRVMREDSNMQTNGHSPTPDLLATVQEQINRYSVSKLIRGSGANISGEDWANDRAMRERMAKLIGEHCSPLASDDVLLALAGSDGSSVERTPAEQIEFQRGMAAGKAAIESEGSNSHEAQVAANQAAFNSSFTGSDYRAGLK